MSTLLDLFGVCVLAWEIDVAERDSIARGEGFFHVSGRGHSGTVALAPHLVHQDWLFCHYRDKALLLARGAKPEDFLNAFFSKDASASRGRQMSTHFSDRALRVYCQFGPVGNNALPAVGVAAAISDSDDRPIVVCGLGDGATQQGTVYEAMSEAVRASLPVLFVVTDNGYAISTRTRGQTFFSLPSGNAESFLGMPIHRSDGADIAAGVGMFGPVVTSVRATRAPALLVISADRLDDHSNSDDQRAYRSSEEIGDAWARREPLTRLGQELLRLGVSAQHLLAIRDDAKRRVTNTVETCHAGPEPKPVFVAVPPETGEVLVRPASPVSDAVVMTMLEAIRATLCHILGLDSNVVLLGQDIEDPKGDVFGTTRGLSSEFPGRVVNAPLAEATVVGTAIGRALAGQRPVAMIQFADFLPLAFNQIVLDLAMVHWRTGGTTDTPVVVMAPCGGYRPGLGPYHAQTFDSTFAHIPGLDVFVPSTPSDAAGLLAAALSRRTPCVFLYPKLLLNSRSAAQPVAVGATATPGVARAICHGNEATVVTWGSTVAICEEAANQLAGHGMHVDLLDLRTLAPWDRGAVVSSSRRTGRLLVVHEDNLTAGFGAEVIAWASEAVGPSLCTARVARADTHLPYHFGNQLAVLPGVRSVLDALARLVGFDLEYEPPPADAEETEATRIVIRAPGQSPSDGTVTVLRWLVNPGETVRAGDLIAEIESDKATAEMASPCDGRFDQQLVPEGTPVDVDTPIALITGRGARMADRVCAPARVLSLRRHPRPDGGDAPHGSPVFLSVIAAAKGSLADPNSAALADLPGRTEEEIEQLSGISSRVRADEGETRLVLAMRAVNELFARHPALAGAIDMIVASSSSVDTVCPSLACQILTEINRKHPGCRAHAFDLSAACSGYLYALKSAWDHVRLQPGGLALVVTSEVLTPLIDPHDFSTRIIFGDAATACLVGGQALPCELRAYELQRPVLFAKGDRDNVLTMPPMGAPGHLRMDGQRVFREAVRSMTQAIRAACDASGTAASQLSLIVPHQANQRIIEAVSRALNSACPAVISNIARVGNTSSSSIPLALSECDATNADQPIALCAFGGGFTYGAALVRSLSAGPRAPAAEWSAQAEHE